LVVPEEAAVPGGLVDEKDCDEQRGEKDPVARSKGAALAPAQAGRLRAALRDQRIAARLVRKRTAPPTSNTPATQRARVASPAASSRGHSICHSTWARSIIQCHPVWATSAERTMMPTRPASTYRRSSDRKGSIA